MEESTVLFVHDGGVGAQLAELALDMHKVPYETERVSMTLVDSEDTSVRAATLDLAQEVLLGRERAGRSYHLGPILVVRTSLIVEALSGMPGTLFELFRRICNNDARFVDLVDDAIKVKGGSRNAIYECGALFFDPKAVKPIRKDNHPLQVEGKMAVNSYNVEPTHHGIPCRIATHEELAQRADDLKESRWPAFLIPMAAGDDQPERAMSYFENQFEGPILAAVERAHEYCMAMEEVKASEATGKASVQVAESVERSESESGARDEPSLFEDGSSDDDDAGENTKVGLLGTEAMELFRGHLKSNEESRTGRTVRGMAPIVVPPSNEAKPSALAVAMEAVSDSEEEEVYDAELVEEPEGGTDATGDTQVLTADDLVELTVQEEVSPEPSAQSPGAYSHHRVRARMEKTSRQEGHGFVLSGYRGGSGRLF